jgi:hypothetical protein
METYLAAIVSFYLKPRKRLWRSGLSESTIEITAPKIIEPSRTKDITSDEATHRLSFLADLIDSKGNSIKGATNSPMREEFYAEAMSVSDMLDTTTTANIDQLMQKEDTTRHEELVNQMKSAIANSHTMTPENTPTIQKHTSTPPPASTPPPVTIAPNPDLINLANDDDLSVATIAKEANRLSQKHDDEIFVSLR